MLYEYDGEANLISQKTEGITTRSYSYEKGKPCIIRDASGNETALKYDGRGNIVEKTDALGNTTSYVYDIKNRVVSETDACGGVTAYTYD